MVDVPATGEKVRCECGQKFRFDTSAGDTTDEQGEAPLIFDLDPGEGDERSASPDSEVRCPRCGNTVSVPTTGEKVRCSECGQKFRFDVPADAAAKGLGEEAAPRVSEVRCPGCGAMVSVPTTGEKVRCSECGQKFRFDVTADRRLGEEAEDQLVLEIGGRGGERQANDVCCPRCGATVAVPTTGEKARCPGCGRKFRFDVPREPEAPREEPPAELPEHEAPAEELPSPVMPAPGPSGSAAEADELRDLWPRLRQFITQLYEEGEATDADRRLFRLQVDRGAELAGRVLPPPEDEGREALEIITSVLPATTLDEIIALSLEDFRHLREGLDEAQALLDRHLPKPEPGPEQRPVAQAPRAAPRRAAAPRSHVAAAIVGLAALVGVGFGVVVAVLVIRGRLNAPDGRRRTWAETLGVEDPRTSGPRTPGTGEVEGPRHVAPATGPAAGVERPGTGLAAVTPGVATSLTPTPTFVEPSQPPATPTPGVERPKPSEVPMKRVMSRWKAGADGWIMMFNRRDLDGWLGNPERWSVRDGALYGVMPIGSSTVTAQEAEWTDYTLAVEAKLGKKGTLVLHHGPLAALIANGRARLGYPAEGWRTLDEVAKGAERNRWYRVELDARGRKAEIRVDGKVVLASAGHGPQPGAPAIEVQSGGVAVRNIRLRLHPTDPDHRAVALGEGWLVAARPPSTTEAPTERTLPPGIHDLFNGANFAGWTRSGDWSVRGGLMVARAGMGRVSVVSTGSSEWRDYSFKARCRLTRKSRIAREGEYFLVIVRYQDDLNFFCIRFATEGIYELGYYHNGRWRETSRARHGLGTDFNKWRDIQITVRGDQLSLVIDDIGGKPPWPIPRRYSRGGVALGVTGGEATFGKARVNLPR